MKRQMLFLKTFWFWLNSVFTFFFTAVTQQPSRLHLLTLITATNSLAIQWYLFKPPEKRIVRIKSGDNAGKVAVTMLDYQNDFIAAKLVTRFFPDDSIFCEEIILGREEWAHQFGQDPIDATALFAQFTMRSGLKDSWISTMTFWESKSNGCMFGLGLPIKGEIYIGNDHDLFLNGHRYCIPNLSSELLIGINDAEYASLIKQETGRESFDIAGMTAWAILRGLSQGGRNQFMEYHESKTIECLIRCAGGTVTSLNGGPYDSGNDSKRANPFMWGIGIRSPQAY
jgi:hypothetical protein